MQANLSGTRQEIAAEAYAGIMNLNGRYFAATGTTDEPVNMVTKTHGTFIKMLKSVADGEDGTFEIVNSSEGNGVIFRYDGEGFLNLTIRKNQSENIKYSGAAVNLTALKKVAEEVEEDDAGVEGKIENAIESDGNEVILAAEPTDDNGSGEAIVSGGITADQGISSEVADSALPRQEVSKLVLDSLRSLRINAPSGQGSIQHIYKFMQGLEIEGLPSEQEIGRFNWAEDPKDFIAYAMANPTDGEYDFGSGKRPITGLTGEKMKQVEAEILRLKGITTESKSLNKLIIEI